jgi:O-antigen ligase
MLFLLTSRVAIFIAIFILPIILFNTLKIRYPKRKIIITLIGFLFLFSLIGFSIQFTRDKMLFTYYELAKIKKKRKPFLGISVREQVWKSSFDLIKEAPYFGYGIGDVQLVLNNKHKLNEFRRIKGMNAHNQYLQFLLSFGAVFTGIILLVLLTLLRNLIKEKEFLLLYFWSVLLLFSVSESILQRQWGVIIFAFILNFSILRLNEPKKLRNSNF